MNRRTAAVVSGGLSVAFALGWVAGRSWGVPTEPYARGSASLDSQAMQLLLRNDSLSAATPTGKVRLSDADRLPLPDEPDVAYFPAAIEQTTSSQSVSALTDEQQRAWDESLSHLPPNAVHEIQALKTKLGSIAASSLGLSQLQPNGVEPAVLKLPDDGSLKPAIVETASATSLQPATNGETASNTIQRTDEGATRLPRGDVPLELWSTTETHNARHLKTVGFKRSVLIQLPGGDQPVWEQRIDPNQGSFQETGNSFDVAIAGTGWLIVMDGENQERLTRAGILALDNKRRLTVKTAAGRFVLSPTVVFPENARDFSINSEGRCSVISEDNVAQDIGSLELGRCLNSSLLRYIDAGLYATTDESGPISKGSPGRHGFGILRQGSLEASNVAAPVTR